MVSGQDDDAPMVAGAGISVVAERLVDVGRPLDCDPAAHLAPLVAHPGVAMMLPFYRTMGGSSICGRWASHASRSTVSYVQGMKYSYASAAWAGYIFRMNHPD